MTGTAPTPAPAPPPAEYRCRRCGRLLGESTPDGLRLGGALVGCRDPLGGAFRKVTIRCAGCGHRWTWPPHVRPGQAPSPAAGDPV